MDKKLQINASVDDVFKKAISKGESIFTDSVMKYRNYYDYRGLNLSVSYTFGNNKVKGASRNVKFDEKSRAN